MMKEISIIVATSTKYGIGYDNKMCWNIPEEMANFRKITTTCYDNNKKNCVVMGKNTWLSLPNGALKNRINIIISSDDKEKLIRNNCDDFIVVKNVEECFNFINSNNIIEKAFIIGGAQLYNSILEQYSRYIYKIYLSVIYDKDYLCDRFINHEFIYKYFHFDKENIHFTERYVYMIGYNKEYDVKQLKQLVIDEGAD